MFLLDEGLQTTEKSHKYYRVTHKQNYVEDNWDLVQIVTIFWYSQFLVGFEQPNVKWITHNLFYWYHPFYYSYSQMFFRNPMKK